jgi:phosphoenolpyruvate synthase/pyruvate phosphate dikinase
MENNVCHTKPCISDDVLKKLVYLCVQIESVFGSPQDIEWVIVEVYFIIFIGYITYSDVLKVPNIVSTIIKKNLNSHKNY